MGSFKDAVTRIQQMGKMKAKGIFTEVERPASDLDENGENAIFRAVRSGARQYNLEQMVKVGAKWKLKNDHGQNILHVAAESGNLPALEYFLSLGAKVKSKDNLEETVLHRASRAKRNFRDILHILLEKGLKINAVDIYGNTLLLVAIKWGRSIDELKEVVNMGADWQIRNRSGETVLHMAARVGNVEALAYFVSLGADVRAKDISTWTVLHKVIYAKENFVETVQYLVERKLDINALDDLKNNLVLLAALNGVSKAGLEEIVQQGGDWQAKNVYGENVLHASAEGGNLDALEYFISLGADVHAETGDWETPLHKLVLAPRDSFKDCLDVLIKAGALPKTETKSGKQTLEGMLRKDGRKKDARLVKGYKIYK